MKIPIRCRSWPKFWPNPVNFSLVRGTGYAWARSHCRFVPPTHPRYTRITNIFGTSFSETTMRPNPSYAPDTWRAASQPTSRGSRCVPCPPGVAKSFARHLCISLVALDRNLAGARANACTTGGYKPGRRPMLTSGSPTVPCTSITR